MDTARIKYSKLRKNAMDRLRRVKNNGGKYTDYYMNNINRFPKVSAIESSGVLKSLTLQLEKFLKTAKAPKLTNKPKKRLSKSDYKRIETLNKYNDSGVNEKNFLEFTRFINRFKAKELDKIYSSETALRMFKKAKRNGINTSSVIKNFKNFLEIEDTLDLLKQHKGAYTYEQVEEALRQYYED